MMLKGVTFDGKHCEKDFGFILRGYTIGPSEPEIVMLPVPGGQDLDYTDFFGKPKYKGKPLKLELKTLAAYEAQPAKHSALCNAINGRRMKVILEDDPSWYYDARISVGELAHGRNGHGGYTTVTCLCRPYKKRVKEAVVTQSVTTAPVSVTLRNDEEPVVPDINATVPCELTFGGGSYSIPAGKSILPDLLLGPGNNVVQVKSRGAAGGITFKWRGGSQ